MPNDAPSSLTVLQQRLLRLERQWIALRAEQVRAKRWRWLGLAILVLGFGVAAGAGYWAGSKGMGPEGGPQSTAQSGQALAALAGTPLADPAAPTQAASASSANSSANLADPRHSALQKLAAAGDKAAMRQWAEISLLDPAQTRETGLNWLRKAADAGDVTALIRLGALYGDGLAGVPANGLVAARYYESAVAAGAGNAALALARLYERGIDGVPDKPLALSWYQQAAASQDPAIAAAARAALSRLRTEGAPATPIIASKATPQTASPTAASQPDRGQEGAQGRAQDRTLTRPELRELQNLLSRRGYKIGRPDGYMGARTANAIRAYQKKEGLPVNGRATLSLLERAAGRNAS